MRPTTVAAVATVLALVGCTSPNRPDPLPRPARGEENARAEMRDVHGQSVGTVMLRQTASELILSFDLTGLPPGLHGVHVHESGRCDAPFTSAGGHFSPGLQRMHGFRNANGPHAGDLPNIGIPAGGAIRTDITTTTFTLSPGPRSVFDADSSAIIIHAGTDDYLTDPSGKSGDRIACGVIVR